MPLVLLVIALWVTRWLNAHIYIETPHWLELRACRIFGHKWSPAEWHEFPDPVYLTHAWICYRCGEQREELTRMTLEDLRALTYEEWEALEKQTPK